MIYDIVVDGYAFDTETWLIEPGILAPKLVCASVAHGVRAELLDKPEALAVFRGILKDKVIIGANIAYDMLVMATYAAQSGLDLMPEIFAAYEQGRVYDILIAEKLDAIANGHMRIDRKTGLQTGYGLTDVVRMVLGRDDAKANDAYRLRYGEFDGVPFAQWPPEATQYPLDDARNTFECALGQVGQRPRIGPHDFQPTATAILCRRCGVSPSEAVRGCEQIRVSRNLHDHAAQVYKAWALHLGAAWGLRTDAMSIAALKEAASVGRLLALPEAQRHGFVRADGSEDGKIVRERVALAYGADPLSMCAECSGYRRVPSTPTDLPWTIEGDKARVAGKRVPSKTCVVCNGTGLDLNTAPALPRTAPSSKFPHGQVQIGRDTLIESGDEDLMAYGQSQEDDKILDTYVPFLEQGVIRPITLRPNTPLETGRVSYSGEVQLLPRNVSARLGVELRKRNGPLGVRDCIVPRPGHVFFSNDYTGGELVCFAQAAKHRVGWSDMGEALKRGVKVHYALGATIMGVSYERIMEMAKGADPIAKRRAKQFQQAAKPQNFGNPGGMGVTKTVAAQRKQGPDTPHPSGPVLVGDGAGNMVPGYKGLRFCVLVGAAERCGEHKVTSWNDRPCPPLCRACLEVADRGRKAWFRQWSEGKPYLDWHAANVDWHGEVEQLYSRRIRGGLDFCSAANGDFQALLADIAGRALTRVVKAQYTDRSSVLYGSRTIVFAHDELFGECREDVAAEVSEAVNTIMVEEFRRGCPDYQEACGAEPTIMPRWYKQAECVRDANGRLQLWRPTT